jgi:diamine N-acetyltransferase
MIIRKLSIQEFNEQYPIFQRKSRRVERIMKRIPAEWKTKRLIIGDLRKEEIHRVQTLYEKGSYIHQWDGGSLDEGFVKRCFLEGDLPPGGTKENFRIQVIRMKESDELVGLLVSYRGHQTCSSVVTSYAMGTVAY